MKTKILIASIFAVLLISCQDTSKPAHQHGHDESPVTSRVKKKSEHSGRVSLNNGEKWPANAETTGGIRKMATLLDQFPSKPELEDYHALNQNLETEFRLIHEKCTMRVRRIISCTTTWCQ